MSFCRKNHRIACLCAVIILTAVARAATRDSLLLTSRYSPAAVAEALVAPRTFAPVPRGGSSFWRDSLPDGVRRSYIALGEQHAGQPWPSLPATVFAQFKETGRRTAYESLCFAKRSRLAALVMAEVAEGRGRFMPDIIDGLQSTLEETWWGLPAHYKTKLPVAADQNVDLFNAETAGLVAWTAYMLSERLDSFSPLLRRRIDGEIARRVLTPALKTGYWWKRAGMNWNPWICSNWLACVLLCEPDRDRQTAAVAQIMTALDAFIDAYPSDGGCDEGPGYWDRAAASLHDCLYLLREATGGLVDLSDSPKVRAMGSYIYNMYIGGGYFVNFADAHHNRMLHQLNAVAPFARYTGDATMRSFAAFTARQQHFADSAAAIYMRSGNWPALARELVMLRHCAATLLTDVPAEPQLPDTWLPDLQVMTARRGSLFVAVKGGHNDESHNHNDVGSFIVYDGGRPLLIDPGTGEYTAQTFGGGRYDIWTMQSAYHNLPLINGCQQAAGRQYAARHAVHSRGRLTLDIAAAYPDSAAVSRWTREVRMRPGSVELTDDYLLDSLRDTTRLVLMTTLRPDVSVPGTVSLGATGRRIVYSRAQLTAAAEDVSHLLDPLLRSVWGPQLYRITLTVLPQRLRGRITYRVE